MKANLSLLALLLTATGLSAQVAPPTTAKGLTHEELLRQANAAQPAATSATTAAAVPDWSVTNAPRNANASAAAKSTVVAQNDDTAARMAAALTNARPVTPRPPRPANLPAAPVAPAATIPAFPTATPPPPGVLPAPPAASTPAPAPTLIADPSAITIRPPANANNISEPNRIYPAGTIDFPAASLEQILTIYAELVGRNMLRPTALNMKQDIVLKQTTALTKLEVVQMIEAALYLNQVSVINVGEKFVTVMPTAEAFKIPGVINTNAVGDLPVLGTILTHVVQLKYVKPSEMQAILTPFASGTAPNPIFPVDSSGILVLRDNVANVKRMLEMIDKVDVRAESEIISEVIPIKYAKAEEIASALSSVGGSTAGSVGTRSSSSSRSTSAGANRLGGLNQPGAYNQPGGAVPGANPTPSSNATFGDRVRNLISKAAGAGDFNILGETKIIADVRSNSLLVFASRQDLEMIKEIVGKLDVVLAQVLIETIILDVTMSDSWNFGVSGVQYVKQFGDNPKNLGLGGINNGNSVLSALTNTFPSGLSSGLSYFGRMGSDPSFEATVQAFASDNRVNVIQKPRIQTSHATPASIFIGSTVPYVSGTYYGYGAGTGGSSSYQQLKVGIGLNVTPFINQDGLVVMQIDETIDELDGSTPIANVGNVPNTKSSTLSAEIAVRDRETIILGGIIRNSDTKNKSGVPLLKDIPLIGALFSSRDSAKKRQELIVLMRPTVLRTPEAASLQVNIEKERLPGVRAAEKQLDRVELERANKEQKARGSGKSSNFQQTTPFSAEDEKVLHAPAPSYTP